MHALVTHLDTTHKTNDTLVRCIVIRLSFQVHVVHFCDLFKRYTPLQHPTRLEILRAELSHRRRKRLEHERNEFLLKKKNSEGLDATETEPIHSDGPNPA
ncbi:hypothetical protein SARC_16357 [Sphaeroforma arctica JP610]|uniref:Uncharacterized protein n=1 Tax=Sphaeroforma arctica JP610 TaxID=667725 RepID=A0A0L0F346_9EUKA|nr:hypothetical protein SARC_16357 [Sphaeroforma arctica JP610]KNC71107.1 hypothetical protein SARC_16357 [Sphaeroforma arctica JP610]|eukprot:XP_014145009.1 hypothetical protein SARC_16357 [Sphaeroforma arctica JP610]